MKRKFKINGKEYNSFGETPLTIQQAREAFKKLLDSQIPSDRWINSVVAPNKIIFNGAEYEVNDSMPQDLHQPFEKVPKAEEIELPPPGVDIAGISDVMLCNPNASSTARLGEIRKPIKGESSLSRRKLIVTAVLMALFLFFYFLPKG